MLANKMEKCGLHNNKIRVNSILLKNITPKILIFVFWVCLPGGMFLTWCNLPIILKLGNSEFIKSSVDYTWQSTNVQEKLRQNKLRCAGCRFMVFPATAPSQPQMWRWWWSMLSGCSILVQPSSSPCTLPPLLHPRLPPQTTPSESSVRAKTMECSSINFIR